MNASSMSILYVFLPLVLGAVLTASVAIASDRAVCARKGRLIGVVPRIIGVIAAALAVHVTVLTVPGLLAYDGNCYGFTDGRWPCNFGEALVHNVGFGLLASFAYILGYLLAAVAGVAAGVLRPR